MIDIKNKVIINTSKDTLRSEILSGKQFFVREKLLRFLFGANKRITVITFGESVDKIIIDEKEEK